MSGISIGLGAQSGTTALGARPGTSTTDTAANWKGTPIGRATLFAAIAAVIFVGCHMAAQNREV
jgi:hypothetical protein